MRRWWIKRRWLFSALVVLSSLGVAIGSSAGIALAAGATYTSCVQANSFPADLAGVTSGSATFTFPANCMLDLTSSLEVAAGVSITVDGAGLVLDGQTKTFDVITINDTQSNPSSLTLDEVTLTHGQNGITESGSGSITLTGSTISDNSADGINARGGTGGVGGVDGNGGNGGAGGTVMLTTSTISANGASGIDARGGPGGSGGNGSDGSEGSTGGVGDTGGNGGIGGANGLSTLTATILANSGQGQNCTGVNLTDDGYNLSDDASCGFSATGSHNSVAPSDLDLGTLKNSGGPTKTIPLLPGSIAIDAIPTGTVSDQTICLNASSDPIVDPVTTDPVITDQRGVPRPQGAKCDIGAYEAATMATSTVVAAASAADSDTSVTLSATVTVPTCAVPNNDCGVVDQGTVTFSVTDSSSSPVGTDVSGDVANGSASASWTLPSGVTPGSYTITASYHDATGLYTDSQDTNTLTISVEPPASLTLSPGDTSATVGDSVTETATVKDQSGNLVADGTTVTFGVTGSNPTSDSATTVNGQASFTYSGTITGKDTLTATATGGSSPSDSATITWGAPTSTARASLSIVNPFSPQIDVVVQTGANGGMTGGVFTYVSSAVHLSQVQLTGLVVSGSQATLYGRAKLANGTQVTFRLDASQGRVFGTVRLRLSNGYDSGNQSVLVRVTP